MPEITPELVDKLSLSVYRQQLDSDIDREKFDALPEPKRLGRARCYAGIVRATLRALGYAESMKAKKLTEDFLE